MIPRVLILLGGLLACCNAFSVDANYAETGAWVKESLVVKQRDKWPVERCFTLTEGQRLQYRFSAPFKVKYDFHMIPSTAKSRTPVVIRKRQEKLSGSADHKAALAGSYCVTFFAITPLPQNWNITLRYRID